MSRYATLFAILAVAGVMAGGAGAQNAAPPYGLPLSATITDVETSDLAAAANAGIASALDRQGKILTANRGAQGLNLLSRMGDARSGSIVRIRVQFANLPQRALAPRLLANGREIGYPIGEAVANDKGVEIGFVILPRALSSFNFDRDAPVELAVQMGDDERTKSILRSPRAVDAIRAALAPR